MKNLLVFVMLALSLPGPIVNAQEMDTFVLSSLPDVIEPVHRSVDPYPAEQVLMQQYRKTPNRSLVHKLSELRYQIGTQLFTKPSRFDESLELAFLYAESATELNPTEVRYWGLLSQIADNLASEADFYPATITSLTAMKKVVQLRPDDFSARLLLADRLVKQRAWKDALDQFETALKLEPEALGPQVVNMMNVCYLEAPQSQRGIHFYQSLLGDHHGADYLRLSIAILYKRQQNNQKAESLILNILRQPDTTIENKAYARRLLSFWNEQLLMEVEVLQ